MVVEMELAI